VTGSAFQVVGDSLSGRGLSFDVTGLLAVDAAAPDAREAGVRAARIAEIAEVAFRQGRASATLSWDDRFDLGLAVDALRALAVIVGPAPMGDRHRRAADLIAQMLQDQVSP